MELRHLRSFVAVAEELNFHRAAERLRIAQPALSQQVGALERELGTALLERTRRTVALTRAGDAFLPEARLTLRQAERARLTGERAGRGEVGVIELGYVASASYTSVLSGCVLSFRNTHPDVEIRLSMDDTERQIHGLMQRSLDAGFIRLPLRRAPAGLCTAIVQRDPLLVALRHDHPLAVRETIALGELAEQTLVGMQPGRSGIGYWEQITELCGQSGFVPHTVGGLSATGPQNAHQLATIVGLVGAGLGVAIVPACMRAFQPGDVVYRSLSGVTARAELALAWRADTSSAIVKAFIADVLHRIVAD